MEQLKKLFDSVVVGDASLARSLTVEALKGGKDPTSLLNQCLIPAMSEVGSRFETGDYFVPEILMASRAMKSSLELLRPLLAQSGTEPVGRVAIGTVKGDLHDIGKNLVASMLEGGGFEVIDLGVDVKAEKFIDAIVRQEASVLAMSALLTTTMGSMKAVVDAVELAGLRKAVKVIIGGAPITQRYADEIGADGYSDNAAGAVALTKRLLGVQIGSRG